MKNTTLVDLFLRAFGVPFLVLGLFVSLVDSPSVATAQEMRLDPGLVKGPDAC